LPAKNDRVSIAVEDNGIGLPKSIETGGMGLRIMRFRAKMINASLDIGSMESRGTGVQLSFEAPGNTEG
jgi:nitrate/nitrite-specific signal transduction histidine kinase